MKQKTREVFTQLKRETAQINQITDTSEKFSLVPSIEQRLVDQQGESSAFLKNINVIGVTEQKGQKLGLGVGQPIASRTNTDDKERQTAFVGEMTPDDYECKQTNFDIHISYRVLDAWAVFTDFATRYRRAAIKRMALDRIMTGWNGLSAAPETDRAANPLLQDVNIGWFEKVRLNNPVRLLGYDSSGLATSDELTVDEGGLYKTLDALVFDISANLTLDALVFDISANLLDPWFVGGDDLVLIIGRELWVNHGLTLYNDNRAATERNALQIWFANEAIGGLKTISVPFFPPRGLVVTSYDNLSLYYQQGSMRRAIIDNPKRDRVEEYFSFNDAYVVEDYGKFAGVRPTAIQLKDANGNWA